MKATEFYKYHCGAGQQKDSSPVFCRERRFLAWVTCFSWTSCRSMVSACWQAGSRKITENMADKFISETNWLLYRLWLVFWDQPECSRAEELHYRVRAVAWRLKYIESHDSCAFTTAWAKGACVSTNHRAAVGTRTAPELKRTGITYIPFILRIRRLKTAFVNSPQSYYEPFFLHFRHAHVGVESTINSPASQPRAWMFEPVIRHVVGT